MACGNQSKKYQSDYEHGYAIKMGLNQIERTR